jgi:hypothetical protein
VQHIQQIEIQAKRHFKVESNWKKRVTVSNSDSKLNIKFRRVEMQTWYLGERATVLTFIWKTQT